MAFLQALNGHTLSILCDFCFRNVTYGPYVRCAVCSLDLCLRCFFSRVETSAHSADHPFRIVSELAKELCCSGWSALDELLFLYGTVTMGVGNLEELAALFPAKGPREIDQHLHALIGLPSSITDGAGQRKVEKSDPNDPVLLGYLPLRRDFESLILNEYEETIVDISFKDAEGPLVGAFKTHMLEYYRVVLKQRRMWKKYIFDRGLVDVHRIRGLDAGELGAVAAKNQWLAQYISKGDMNRFLGGLLREMRLRRALASKGGATAVDEAQLCDVEKFLGNGEKELCARLRMAYSTYGNLKRIAIECHINGKSLRPVLESLFGAAESKRSEILYRWFERQLSMRRE